MVKFVFLVKEIFDFANLMQMIDFHVRVKLRIPKTFGMSVADKIGMHAFYLIYFDRHRQFDERFAADEPG